MRYSLLISPFYLRWDDDTSGKSFVNSANFTSSFAEWIILKISFHERIYIKIRKHAYKNEQYVLKNHLFIDIYYN